MMAVSDWDRRELCPDGSCTGLIGAEGTCKVCGRAAPNWGDERKRGTQDESHDEEDGDEDVADADPIQPAAKVAIGGGEWSARKLCTDGACVGVIGADGKCKVCGKSAAGGALAEAEAEAEEDEDYEDEDEDYEDEDAGEDAESDADDAADDAELAAAAAQLAGVASSTELESAKELAHAGDTDNRKLCPDGACIGVIGPDGKCKICRKEAA